MINQDLHTASLTNQDISSSGLTWDEATFSWEEGGGTWENPYGMKNQNLHTATITNQDLSV